MNYKKYIKYGITHIIEMICLTALIYNIFDFKITVLYLFIEAIASIMGIRLELIRLFDRDKGVSTDEYRKAYEKYRKNNRSF